MMKVAIAIWLYLLITPMKGLITLLTKSHDPPSSWMSGMECE